MRDKAFICKAAVVIGLSVLVCGRQFERRTTKAHYGAEIRAVSYVTWADLDQPLKVLTNEEGKKLGMRLCEIRRLHFRQSYARTLAEETQEYVRALLEAQDFEAHSSGEEKAEAELYVGSFRAWKRILKDKVRSLVISSTH